MHYWSDELISGIDVLDKQHKELCQKANNLFQAYMNGNMHQEIENCIKYLENYINIHFKYEEKVMEELEYPKISQHREKHNQFYIEYKSLKNKMPEISEIDEDFIKLKMN